MSKKYSKPVLTPDDNSAYKSEYSFTLDLEDPEVLTDDVLISGIANINCSTVSSLINEDKAFLILKVRSNLRSFTFQIDSNHFSISLPRESLERLDTIRCRAFVAAKTGFTFSYTPELKDVFEPTFQFDFQESELLAESNEERLDYKTSGEPFIHILKSPDNDNKGLIFSDEPSNMIQIKVGPTFHEAYSKLQSEQIKIPQTNIVNSSLAFDAILYTLFDVISKKDVSLYKDKDWFKALDYCYVSGDSKYDSLEDFLNAMIEEMDVGEIFAAAQKMLNNQIEVQVIDAWRRAK